MDLLERARLFNFYSGLLSEKQREYYDLYYNEDLSLAEIAENVGFSRQGVWETLNRADTTLAEAEQKLGFISFAAKLGKELGNIAAELEKAYASEKEAAEVTALKSAERLRGIASAELGWNIKEI